MIIDEESFAVCSECGVVSRRHLDTSVISFGSSSTPMRHVYTRKGRFSTKIIGTLLRTGLTPMLHTELVDIVRNCVEPEDVVSAIAAWKPPANTRRPYIHAAYYWIAAGGTLPDVPEHEIRRVILAFEDCFFAWHRLNIVGPSFPYVWLLRALVAPGNGLCEFSEGLRMITRFTKPMRCEKRNKRYAEIFKKCVRYVNDTRAKRSQMHRSIFPAPHMQVEA